MITHAPPRLPKPNGVLQHILKAGAVVFLAVLIAAGLFFPLAARAAPLILLVDRFDDDPAATICALGDPNDCSLRGAIITANANLGPDTITLPAGTYTLTQVGTGEAAALNGDLDIMGDLTINGDPTDPTIIDGNGSVTLENVFTIDGSYSAEMNDLTIQNGDGTPVGGIIAFGGLTLNNVTVDDNHGTGSGGGIYVSTALSLTNSTVSNNTAANGAGIYVHNGTVTITSSTLSGNIATGPGGGIYQNGGTVTIESTSQVTLNQASGGGGIATNGGTLAVNDSSIHINQATSSGGGIYIGSSGSVTLTNTNVNQNTSVGSGSSGGGIQSYGALEMNGGQISLNTTASDGGGLNMYGASAIVNIYDATINSNHTTDDDSYGGGIANYYNGQLTLTRSTVSNNYMDGTASSSTYGGGIHSSSATLTLTDSLILDNDAIDSGGGVDFSNGTLTITNTIFRGNEVSGTTSAGGGLYNGSFSTATVKQTEFSGNTSANISGGIHNQSTLTLENVTLSGNSAKSGAGMLSTGSDTTSILNSTIYANIVPSGSTSGGLVAYNAVTIKNTIIAGNDNDECLNSSGTAITSNGNNISGDATCGFSAGGDQPNTDPLLGPLADNGGFSKTHAPLNFSPAIDTGTNTGCPAVDQRYVNRPIDGDLNGTATCDVGAYETTIDLFLPLIMR
jgi:predicted outer membrane repeat protein